MPAYIVVEAIIDDFEKFIPYTKVVPDLVARFGGEYLAIGTEHDPLEGDWGKTRIVIHQWPSMAAAREFWGSDEYAKAKQLRKGTGEFRVMLVDGLNKEELE